MLVIQWLYAAYDYLLKIYDDLLYSNWWDHNNKSAAIRLVQPLGGVTFTCFLLQAWDDAHSVADLLSPLHPFWHSHHSGFQVRGSWPRFGFIHRHCCDLRNCCTLFTITDFFFVFSEPAENKPRKPKPKEQPQAEADASSRASTSRYCHMDSFMRPCKGPWQQPTS